MKYLYKHKNEVSTAITVNEELKKVSIVNYTKNPLYRAFGINEHPTFEDFENFLESRCFPKTVDELGLHLQELGLTDYDPYKIIEKTNGKLGGDSFSLEIVND